MSLDDITKMNNEKKRKFKFGVKKNFRNKRLNNNNKRIRGGHHFRKKNNDNYKQLKIIKVHTYHDCVYEYCWEDNREVLSC